MEEVECIASASYPGDPRALYWEGVRYEIERTLAQWRTPQEICFRVKTTDGGTFNTCYQEATRRWFVEAL